MDRLTSMDVFASIVANGSFAGAARQAQVSPTVVSKHVQALEQIELADELGFDQVWEVEHLPRGIFALFSSRGVPCCGGCPYQANPNWPGHFRMPPSDESSRANCRARRGA